ncbi:hypothetical protein [Vibrio parahaemolyticus]|uniref:hypothetical protein n=1 Tax=Vibrio parahaemolyticus TaxID=670 RepID=UPI003D8185DE
MELPTLEQALEMREQGVQHFELATKLMLLMHDTNTNQAQAARLLSDTGAPIHQGTIARMLKGESRPSLTALAIYALERMHADMEHPSDIHPDYQGEQTYHGEGITYTTYFMEADSEQEAINKVGALFDLVPTRNETDYDCTGQWYRSSPQVDYLVGRNCYAVTTTLTLDV